MKEEKRPNLEFYLQVNDRLPTECRSVKLIDRLPISSVGNEILIKRIIYFSKQCFKNCD